jgi:hypothetical protein
MLDGSSARSRSADQLRAEVAEAEDHAFALRGQGQHFERTLPLLLNPRIAGTNAFEPVVAEDLLAS